MVFGGDAYAGVGDFEYDGVFFCLGGVYFDVNLAAVMVVFDGVFAQVEEHFFEHGFDAVYEGGLA